MVFPFHSFTNCCSVHLTNVNLALDDVNRKLVDVVPDFVVAVQESVSASFFSAVKLARV